MSIWQSPMPICLSMDDRFAAAKWSSRVKAVTETLNVALGTGYGAPSAEER
jgi:hypothetical protein